MRDIDSVSQLVPNRIVTLMRAMLCSRNLTAERPSLGHMMDLA